ncbi:MAG TPA: tetratricopeptide repeat protein [Lacipirellulaceae bacterium]|jgi:tetratricopeptide (TPR) repeat protein|nr:tetratricopeptide repeat protein [Lacipirellulaceae bacterium]
MRLDLRSPKLAFGFASTTLAACCLAGNAFAQTTKPADAPPATATDTKTGADTKLDTSAAAPATEGPTPQQLIDKGDAALKAGDFKTALSAYNDLVSMAERGTSPDAFQALAKGYIGRGNALIGLRQFDSAIDDFKKVIDSDANNVAALIGRGKARLELNQTDTALQDFKDAAKADQGSVDAQLGLGKALVSLGHSEEAIAPLTLAIAADEKNAEAYRYRGTAYAGTFKNKEATDDLLKSIELNPDDQEAYYTLAMIHLRAEEYQDAVDELGKAIEHYKPKPGQEDVPYVQGYLTHASALIELGKKAKDDAARKAAYQASVDDCDKLLKQLNEKNPAHAQVRAAALYSRGVAERMLENYGEAVRSFSQAIEINPTMGDAYFRRGICFHNLNEEKMAISDFQQAAHILFDDPRCNLWEGFTYAKMGDYNEAIRAYGDAIAASDRYTPAYANRALAYMMLGDYKKAVNDFNDAIRLNPTTAQYYYQRGVAYEMLKDNQRAAESFATALQFDNKNADTYKHMAIVQQALGHADTAAEYSKKAEEFKVPEKPKK